jgi:cytochrome c-type biogenesis protein
MTFDVFTITEIIKKGSPWTFVVIFWAAAVLSLASCTIVRIPVIVGLIGGASTSKKKAFLLTLSFVSALILSYTLMGVMFSLVGSFAGNMMKSSRYFYYLVAVLVLLVGLQMAGLIRFRFFENAVSRAFQIRHGGMLGAFLFGFVFVLFEAPTCPVCGPFLLVIASLGILKKNLVYCILLFFTYALGQSFPIILVGVFSGIVKYISPKIEAVEKVASIIGGNILILLAIFLFILG